MRLPVVPAILAVAFVLTPAIAGCAPAWSQDFSITNQVDPATAGRRDVMRQLQAWWDVHAYYPRRASNNDECGTVRVLLAIRPDGRIWGVNVVASSGSNAIDTAAAAAFSGGFVRPLLEGAPGMDFDLTLHYVLAHRHDQPVAADYRPAQSRGAFTISNDPVRSPILETMLQRTCTGTVVKEGIRNHPAYGGHYRAEAVFFRKPDGTPWVKFYEGGQLLIAPVTEAGKMVQWTGRAENPRKTITFYYQYTVWPDGDNKLAGNIEARFFDDQAPQGINTGGTVDFTCETEVVPQITWNGAFVNVYQAPSIDPP